MKILTPIIFILFSFSLFAQDKLPCDDVFYTYNVNDVNQLTDFTNRTNGHKIISWFWDFGDGTVSNLPNPKHLYMNSGTYIACLSITTEDGCENTFCDTIHIGFAPLDTNSFSSISGIVMAGPNMLPSGIALLVSRVNTTYIVEQYTNIVNGEYEFGALLSGDYLVYTIPDFNMNLNYTPSYLPSYSGNSVKWENATEIHLGTSSEICHIQLACNNSLLYGPDTIEGSISINDINSFEYNVYNANWFGNIDEINFERAVNMPVLLMDYNNVPLRFTISDEQGFFRFTNLPVKIYKVAPEKPGFTSEMATLNMQTISSNTASCYFSIGTNNISIGITNPDISDFEKHVTVFPNPVSDNAIVSLISEKPQTIYISMEDISGRVVFPKEKFVSSGNENYIVPCSTLNPGVYFVKIQSENLPVVIRKIIKK